MSHKALCSEKASAPSPRTSPLPCHRQRWHTREWQTYLQHLMVRERGSAALQRKGEQLGTDAVHSLMLTQLPFSGDPAPPACAPGRGHWGTSGLQHLSCGTRAKLKLVPDLLPKTQDMQRLSSRAETCCRGWQMAIEGRNEGPEGGQALVFPRPEGNRPGLCRPESRGPLWCWCSPEGQCWR